MFSEEEIELRDIILQNLEKSGFLNKIKAEIRAGVCLAIEEDGNLNNKIPLFNKKFDEFAATREGKLMLSIVREFLDFFNFHYTLSIFDPEIAIDSPCFSRLELSQELKLKSDFDGPIISELIKGKLDISDHKLTKDSTAELMSYENASSNTGFEFTAEKDSNENIGNDEIDVVGKGYENKVADSDKSKFGNSSIGIRNLGNEIVTNKSASFEKVNKETFQEQKSLTSDQDPFFDEPVPSEKSLFSFNEPHKSKLHGKPILEPLNTGDKMANSDLSSLKGLPSLTHKEWTFSKDSKQSLFGIESQKSISSSDTSNEEIINLDIKGSRQNKDLDHVESNESSEKPISEESIEEDIDDDDTAGLDDVFNSLSLGDDVTTDQTVSQSSVIEGVDHVETCKQIS